MKKKVLNKSTEIKPSPEKAGKLIFQAESFADNEKGDGEDGLASKPGDQLDTSHSEKKDDWDLAIRFRDIQRYGYLQPKQKEELTERGIQAVLDQATQSLGPISKPFMTKVLDESSAAQLNSSIHHIEMDIEETLLARAVSSKANPEVYFQARLPRDYPVVLLLDTSLSMKGEKVAILAVTVAALAQVVPQDKLCVLGFDSEIHVIKEFQEVIPLKTVVERTLSIPPGGFTNTTLGLSAVAKRLDRQMQSQARVILVSDGRYTEGKDPVEAARQFRFIYPFKVGKDPGGRTIMKDLADTGQGKFAEVREIKELPKTLMQAIRSWVR